jgi:hypothetical protein
MNVLQFLVRCASLPTMSLSAVSSGNNRINNVGDALEKFVKDVFANAVNVTAQNSNLAYSVTFSYCGNKNNPPDVMIKGGDAIEIKKIESPRARIALNSSYPKDKIYSNSEMLTLACRNCEKWTEKDMLYVIGYVKNSDIKCLWLVYGDCFIANKEIYERLKNKISTGVNEIPDIEFTETNELGKVKKIDPLGVTDLRIRGMWHIDNPMTIFEHFENYDQSSEFKLVCIMQKSKFETMPAEDIYSIESESSAFFTRNESIRNPNNPAQLIDAKIITYRKK